MVEDFIAKYGIPVSIIGYIFIISVFIFYSYLALDHLKNYGYVGDLCQKVKWVYIIISLLIIVASIIAFIVI